MKEWTKLHFTYLEIIAFEVKTLSFKGCKYLKTVWLSIMVWKYLNFTMYRVFPDIRYFQPVFHENLLGPFFHIAIMWSMLTWSILAFFRNCTLLYEVSEIQILDLRYLVLLCNGPAWMDIGIRLNFWPKSELRYTFFLTKQSPHIVHI